MVKYLIAETLCIFNTPNLFSFTFLGFNSELRTILICIRIFPRRIFVLLSEVNLEIRKHRMLQISKLPIKKLRDSKGTELD